MYRIPDDFHLPSLNPLASHIAVDVATRIEPCGEGHRSTVTHNVGIEWQDASEALYYLNPSVSPEHLNSLQRLVEMKRDSAGDVSLGYGRIVEYDLTENPEIVLEADDNSVDLGTVANAVLNRYEYGAWGLGSYTFRRPISRLLAVPDDHYDYLLIVDHVHLEPWARGTGIGPYAVAAALQFLSRSSSTYIAALYAKALPSGEKELPEAEQVKANRKVYAAWKTAGFVRVGRTPVFIADLASNHAGTCIDRLLSA